MAGMRLLQGRRRGRGTARGVAWPPLPKGQMPEPVPQPGHPPVQEPPPSTLPPMQDPPPGEDVPQTPIPDRLATRV